jgi:hypothetical protein
MERLASAPLCPTCSQALKISTGEPHPTRDRADLLTYRCSIHGDICTRIVDQADYDVSSQGQPA